MREIRISPTAQVLAFLTLIGLISVGLTLAWLTSYKQNRDLIEQNEQADEEYASAATGIQSKPGRC